MFPAATAIKPSMEILKMGFSNREWTPFDANFCGE
jgi:hypothetical protein